MSPKSEGFVHDLDILLNITDWVDKKEQEKLFEFIATSRHIKSLPQIFPKKFVRELMLQIDSHYFVQKK